MQAPRAHRQVIFLCPATVFIEATRCRGGADDLQFTSVEIDGSPA
jgi:hypothetical protein